MSEKKESPKEIKYWDALKTPPSSALKKIGGGRLGGMSDISPTWRARAMTEQFGPVGIGWRFAVDKMWTTPGAKNEVFAFVNVTLYIKVEKEWSEGIHGNGGSMLIVNEKSGLHNNDEAFKMATTDALGTAMKSLGMAADIYAGQKDGSFPDSKYSYEQQHSEPQQPQQQQQQQQPAQQTRQQQPKGPNYRQRADELIKTKELSPEWRTWVESEYKLGNYQAIAEKLKEL